METLIVQPKNKEQLKVLEVIFKALKVDFKTEKSTKKPYNPEFKAKMKQVEADVKAGKTTKIEPADIWNLS